MATRPHHPDAGFATTVAHGMDVLHAFRMGEPTLSNKALAERTGLSKATVSRLTTTLAARGLLRFDPALRHYRLGAGILSLGHPLLHELTVRQLARPLMRELADAVGGSVSLGLRDRLGMVYVETSRGHDAAAFRPDIGARLPLLTTAMGRAWLAAADEPDRDAALQALQATPAQRAVVARERRRLQRAGYCAAQGEWQPDVHAVAVPLRLPDTGLALVLNVGVPVHRLRGRDLHTRVAPRLRATRDRIASLLAAQDPALVAGGPIVPPARLPESAAVASTLAHGIDVLACFSPGAPVLANRDLAQATGLSRSAVARLTHTLVTLGYLARDPASGRYRLGAGVLCAGYPLLASMHIRQLARPLMKALAEHAGGAVSLVVHDRQHMVYVETARATESLLTHPDIGATLPLATSAAGKAWLCRTPIAQATAALNRLRLAEPEAHARHQALLDQARRDLASHGWCGNAGEWRPDTYGFAVPLARPYQSQVLVFNCGVPAADGAYARRAADIGPRLVALAHRVEEMLGVRAG